MQRAGTIGTKRIEKQRKEEEEESVTTVDEVIRETLPQPQALLEDGPLLVTKPLPRAISDDGTTIATRMHGTPIARTRIRISIFFRLHAMIRPRVLSEYSSPRIERLGDSGIGFPTFVFDTFSNG